MDGNESKSEIESYQTSESDHQIVTSIRNEPKNKIESFEKNEEKHIREYEKIVEDNVIRLFPKTKTKGLLFMQLNLKSCRFPLWGNSERPNISSSMYCGCPVVENPKTPLERYYCEEHSKIAVVPSTHKKSTRIV